MESFIESNTEVIQSQTTLDYKTCTIDDITRALEDFVSSKIDTICVLNIYPAVFEQAYGMVIDETNGDILDWWGYIEYFHGTRIPVFGSGRYGYIRVEREEEFDE